jgi:hypothetical protein
VKPGKKKKKKKKKKNKAIEEGNTEKRLKLTLSVVSA